LGHTKVGFLSGAPFIRPADATIHYNNRPFLCRLVFLNASLFFIVFSVLFVTEGLTNVRTTLNTLADASNVSDCPAAPKPIHTRTDLLTLSLASFLFSLSLGSHPNYDEREQDFGGHESCG
jgi:hypothetical protein